MIYNKPVVARGTPLAQLTPGSIIKLNENGVPIEFYVAQHDYESGLNGTGRTLVVRKDCCDVRRWDDSGVNAYASSTVDSWLNGDYKSRFDSDIRSAIGTTKFKYTPGNRHSTVGTLERSILLLSVTELGKTSRYANTEGSALDIASTLQIAYMNGSAVVQWTRSPSPTFANITCFVGIVGDVDINSCMNALGIRPAFTLPSTILIDKKGAPDIRYTSLRYIQSGGAQYIDTGFKPNQDTSFELDFDFESANNTGNVHLMSANDANKFFAFRAKADFKAYQARYYTAGLQDIPLADPSIYGRHKIKREKNKISIDGGTVLTQATGTFQVSRNLTICCLRSSTATAECFSNMKVYSFKLWDGDTLIRCMAPVRRNFDGAVGMLDSVNNKFYENAGSGAFVGG